MAENPIFHGRTKHIDLDVHFIWENIKNGDIEIRYAPTKYQVADILTKGLSKSQFQFLCNKLGLRFSPAHRVSYVSINDQQPEGKGSSNWGCESMLY